MGVEKHAILTTLATYEGGVGALSFALRGVEGAEDIGEEANEENDEYA